MSLKKIGILHGMERSFPEAFIDRVNARGIPGLVAEEVLLGGTAMEEAKQYAVIVDRISHEIPYYRSYLKLASLNGTQVINNPFWWSADDKFFGTALAHRLGVAVPRSLLLPNHRYIEGVTERSLHNLQYPLDWDAMLRYVGLPAILKPAQGGGGKDVTKVRSVEELWEAYNRSGELNMMLQECIEWEHYVRCICVGRTHILPIKWTPPFGAPMGVYYVDHEHLSPELGARVLRDAAALNEALGYDMNTVEFAVRDGVPYAIDFTNPAPDMDVHSLTPHYFEIVLEWMTDLAIRKAQEHVAPPVNAKWWGLMGWAPPEAPRPEAPDRAARKNGKPAVATRPGAKAAKPARTRPAAAPARPPAKSNAGVKTAARPTPPVKSSAPGKKKAGR